MTPPVVLGAYVQLNAMFHRYKQDIALIMNVKLQGHALVHVNIGLVISRGQDVIPWDLLAEIDFFVLSYSMTLG